MLNTAILRRTASFLLASLFVLGLFVVPARAQSAEQDIRAMLEKRDRDIKQAVKPLIDNPKTATEAQREKAASLINDQIDFEEMGRQALGKYWADLTEAQRTDFVDVFGEIVRSQSLTDLDVYNARVTYEEISVDGDKAYVKTAITYQDRETTVEYILRSKENAWGLTDIILDAVSTVEGYARSFQAAIRKRGFDGLMKSLYKKRDKIQASS